MNKLVEHFSTDWSSLTTNDWVGLTMTVVTFIFMALAYFYVLKPGNKETLEAHRNIVLNEDSSDVEGGYER